MSGVLDPVVQAFADLFTGFGLPANISFLVSTLTVIGTLGLITMSVIGQFNIPNQGKSYLIAVFFIGIAVIGLIPIWTIVITGLLGIMIVFFTVLLSSERGM